MKRWPPDREHIVKSVDVLRRGAVIAFPTDTLYAVATRAADPRAVSRLYAVKRRPPTQPLVWLVSGPHAIDRFAFVSHVAAGLMQRYWPGPLTLVLPALPAAGQPTLAVRAPDHPLALALLEALDEPLASSSANRAGAAPPLDADSVIAGLGDDIDLVLDGGPCRIGEPSTILDLTRPEPRILRHGAIPAEQLIQKTPPPPAGEGRVGASDS